MFFASDSTALTPLTHGCPWWEVIFDRISYSVKCGCVQEGLVGWAVVGKVMGTMVFMVFQSGRLEDGPSLDAEEQFVQFEFQDVLTDRLTILNAL